MNKASDKSELTAERQIDNIIEMHGGWKSEVLTQIRTAINATDPEIVEEVKWKTASRPEGLPVWSHSGIICIAETWKDNIKLVFFKGAKMKNTRRLFNARLKSSTDRAIEFCEGDSVNQPALMELVREAMDLNLEKAS